ncbi:sel1 repeat family protein [Oxalobacter sp. OttesenSCG-928-P03]|nr:sel1 repeat family protein [Oxalobacter sp. OttesenSCG-928-P03]
MKRFLKGSAVLGLVLQLLSSCLFLPGVALADDLDDGVAYYQKGEYKKAFGVLKRLAERGNPEAQFLLAEMYLTGKGIRIDERLAGKWMLKAAEDGHADAQFAVGLFYRDGFGEFSQSYSRAFYWYEKAARQGEMRAQLMMGQCYDEGTGVTLDRAEAVNWYRKAAEQGSATAQFRMGKAFELGDGAAVSADEARLWYGRAAAQGNADAIERLDAMSAPPGS